MIVRKINYMRWMMVRKRLVICVAAVFITAFFKCTFLSAMPEINLRYPVLLKHETGATASGFYINFEHEDLYFVTAKHVLFSQDSMGRYTGLKSDVITLMSYPTPITIKDPLELELDLKVLMDNGNIVVHPNNDVAIIQITSVRKDETEVALAEGITKKVWSGGSILSARLDSIKVYEDVSPSDEVYIFGYPTSLGIRSKPQIDFTKPLLRKGIVAGKNDARRAIILDCPAYYGNSGGPCIESETINGIGKRYYLIGVVTEFIPFENKWINLTHGLVNSEFENSGYSIVEPVDAILELIKKHRGIS